MHKSTLNEPFYGEILAKNKNAKVFIGIDEVGRGCIAGPVVAASVYLNKYNLDFSKDINNIKNIEIFKQIKDSKKLSEKKREFLYDFIKKNMVCGIGIVDEKIIDEINILNATKLAMLKSVKDISKKLNKINLLLIDGNSKINSNIEQITIVKGDSKSYSIAAASIFAKVTRDRIMLNYDKLYPKYDFKNNKGYPSKKHVLALEEYGVLSIHRKTFKPVKKLDTKIT